MISFKRTIDGCTVDVRTHDAAHLDEYLALLAAERSATREWVRQHCPNGELYLGIGRGEFDEHPDLEQGVARKKEHTATTLMAKSLGVEQHPMLVRLIDYAKRQDLEGEAVEDDFAVLLKTWHYVLDYYRERREEEVLEWALTGLRALMAAEIVRYDFQRSLVEGVAEKVLAERDRIMGSPFRLATMIPIVRDHLGTTAAARDWELKACGIGITSQELFREALKEIAASATVQVIGEGVGQVKLMIITSRNPMIMRAYRSREAGAKRANVLVQFKSTGHFLIAASMKTMLKLDYSAAGLRSAVLNAKIRRRQLRLEDAPTGRTLTLEGSLRGAEELYFFPKGPMIFNGSITNPEIKPLLGEEQLLDRDLVVRLVTEGIRQERAQRPVDRQTKSAAGKTQPATAA